MKKYQAIRIANMYRPTYGDKYLTVTASDNFTPDYHEIYTTAKGDRIMLLFELEDGKPRSSERS